jgi:hypothetical protein
VGVKPVYLFALWGQSCERSPVGVCHFLSIFPADLQTFTCSRAGAQRPARGQVRVICCYTSVICPQTI